VKIKDRLPAFGVDLDEVRGTPTFIFLRDNNEIGRIEGFSDTEMFWWLVDDIIMQIDKTKE
jgi:thioredoxin-related protein